VSLLFDYFGFARGKVPEDPDTSVTAQVSVLDQAARVDGHHFHLNVIRVGFDTLAATDFADGLMKLDYAVYRCRRIFASQGLGIGRVQHYEIATADANGRDDLGTETEADDLSDEWSVDNDGIDAFVVRNISDPDYVGPETTGWSQVRSDDPSKGLPAPSPMRSVTSWACLTTTATTAPAPTRRNGT
jgi:hypothetical protein